MSDKKPKRGLGRGLDALLGDSAPPLGEPASGRAAPREIALSALYPGGFQPRRRFESETLQELAQSISRRGIILPIIARPRAGGGYEIVAGERRVRAAKIAGLETAPVIIRELSDAEALYCGLVENLQRENLNPWEQAQGVARLIKEFHLSHEAAAKEIGVSRPAITNLLRLLELTPAARDLLISGKIQAAHARALLTLPAARQASAARQIAAKNMSARAAESLAKRLKKGASSAADAADGDAGHDGRNTGQHADRDAEHIAESLSRKLGARVQIRPAPGNKTAGRLIIHYATLDTLERVLGKLRK